MVLRKIIDVTLFISIKRCHSVISFQFKKSKTFYKIGQMKKKKKNQIINRRSATHVCIQGVLAHRVTTNRDRVSGSRQMEGVMERCCIHGLMSPSFFSTTVLSIFFTRHFLFNFFYMHTAKTFFADFFCVVKGTKL